LFIVDVQCSEEGDTKGLGIFDIDVIKFTTKVKVPNGLESNL
jgi:imidazoleglycerol phosphate synthase glutamine amidotransferase subunit HisH